MSRPDPVSPGAQLAAARLRAGLSLDQVSQRSRVPRPALEALERDDWAGLPAPIYARGFTRLYAQEVGLDPAPLVALVETGRAVRRQQAKDAAKARSRQARRAVLGGLRRRTAVAVAVGAVVLVVLSAMFSGANRLEADVASDAAPAAAHP